MNTIETYVDTAGEHRWSFKTRNGRIVADSGEGYQTKQGLKKAVTSFRALLKTRAKVKELPLAPVPKPTPEPETPPVV